MFHRAVRVLLWDQAPLGTVQANLSGEGAAKQRQPAPDRRVQHSGEHEDPIFLDGFSRVRNRMEVEVVLCQRHLE